jgi:hypothetical protein
MCNHSINNFINTQDHLQCSTSVPVIDPMMLPRGLPILVPANLPHMAMPVNLPSFVGYPHEDPVFHVERFEEILISNLITRPEYYLIWFQYFGGGSLCLVPIQCNGELPNLAPTTSSFLTAILTSDRTTVSFGCLDRHQTRAFGGHYFLHPSVSSGMHKVCWDPAQ